jgi:hypothetical protein
MGRRTIIVAGATAAVIAAVVASPAAGSEATQTRAAYQPFSSPATAAKRLTASARAEGIHLFHPCAVINPYLIRCGGWIGGLKPLTKSGKLRVRIDWRKVNPYMLDRTVYALGGVFKHALVDTKVAY